MKTISTTVMLLIFAVSAAADPMHIDFTSSNYAGAQGTSTYGRYEASINREVSWDALDNFLNPFGVLTYNNDSGGADGIGMMGRGNYSNDEIEGDERARLRFNESVHVVGLDFTDFFNEAEPNTGDCPVPGCYQESAVWMAYYEDGTHSLWNVIIAPLSNTRSGNGLFHVAVNESNVIAIVFAAFGQTGNKYEEVSIAGVTVDTRVSEVPEPSSFMLVGAGGLWFLRNRRKHVDA